MTAAPDLFGHTPTPPIGLTVQLVNATDPHQHHTKCGDLATIEPGKAMHAAALRCLACGGFRGWVSHFEFNWLTAVIARSGVPDRPIILRNWNTTGEDNMAITEQYDNSGILFRNDDKTNEKDRDYRGEATIAGVGYWVSGWIKQGKKGKFLTFSFKSKDAAKTTPKKTAAEDFNDENPF
jgi:hypothetical protein